MSSFNQATIVGRLGNDPEIRYSAGGVAFGTLSVATSETWKDKESGEKKERTDWHRIKVSGRLAEICGEYLKKGDLALFSGQIRTDKYTKDGVEKFDTHVRADQMQMLSSKRDGETRGGGPVQQRGEKPAPGRGTPPPADEFDGEDIPFISDRGLW